MKGNGYLLFNIFYVDDIMNIFFISNTGYGCILMINYLLNILYHSSKEHLRLTLTDAIYVMPALPLPHQSSLHKWMDLREDNLMKKQVFHLRYPLLLSCLCVQSS